MIDSQLFENIPPDFEKGAQYLIELFNEFDTQSQQYDKIEYRHEGYIELYLAIEAYLEGNSFDFTPVKLLDDKQKNILNIKNFFYRTNLQIEKLLTVDLVSKTRTKFQTMFNNAFCYEFSQGDLDRIRTLIFDLRGIIEKSELYTAEHKQRILKRLEKLQSELHKKVSDVDRFWGLIGDAGVAIGKFGTDAKPIVDRIKEISDIVWRTQARSEELPSGTTIPFLNEGKSSDTNHIT